MVARKTFLDGTRSAGRPFGWREWKGWEDERTGDSGSSRTGQGWERGTRSPNRWESKPRKNTPLHAFLDRIRRARSPRRTKWGNERVRDKVDAGERVRILRKGQERNRFHGSGAISTLHTSLVEDDFEGILKEEGNPGGRKRQAKQRLGGGGVDGSERRETQASHVEDASLRPSRFESHVVGMISSVWLIDREKGSLLAERHWKGRLGTRTASRICLEEGSTVCTKRPHYVVRVDRKKLRAIASSLEEFPPADVIELLSRVLDEMDKKKDPVEAQMLFDEMLDGGLPATTSQVALHSLLPEEDLSQRVSSMLLGNQRITEGSAALPWRRSGISHLKNEFLVDIVEEVHAIVDRGGRHRNAFLVGHVVATSRLSGFPDLMLKFSNPEVMDVCNVHPCVRLKPFQDGRVLSFVPPDGKFTLLSYTAKVTKDLDVVIPIYVRLQTAKDTIVRGLKVNMVVCFKPSPLKVVDDITLSFNLPRETSTVDLDVNQGTLRTEHDTGCCTWDIGQMDQTLTPCLSGTLFSRNSDTLEGLSFAPVARLSYSCAQDTISDLRLQSLKLMNEPQQPYRGLRSIVRSGTYEVCL